MIKNANGNTKILWKNLVGSIGCLGLLGVFYTAICLFGLKLFLFIRSSLVSERTKRMNYQLMELFLIQALVPLFFEYVPCFTNVAAGPLDFPYYEDIGYYQPIFVSLYPFIDSTMVFVGFRDYRNRILSSKPIQSLRNLKRSRIFTSKSGSQFQN
ncbi:unnamed protein product, partial [Mesorhabditis belari]|uniref:Uncharacterized protein n=1 Tax=Mesorhabditis belari TaxID=2138241 RepID=A0AAF3EPQ0_9BILA